MNYRKVESSNWILQVDIDIGFASAKHHDKFPFDGPGKTLAHAFPPGT